MELKQRLTVSKETRSVALFIFIMLIFSRFMFFFTHEIWTLLLESEVMPGGGISNVTKESFISALMRWDASWYIRIIDKGYDLVPWNHYKGDAANWAFFPLYPWSVSVFKTMSGLSTIKSGFLMSNILFFISQIYVYKYLVLTRNKEIALTAVILFIMGPYNFYFSTLYTESLFVMLLVMSFYYMKKENWYACALSTAFLSATRGTGVLFFIPLLINILLKEFKSTKNIFVVIKNIIMNHKKLFVLICAPAGLFMYMTFLYFHMGDPFGFFHVEIAWNRSNANPVIILIEKIKEGGIPKLYLGAWGILGIVLSVYLMVTKRIEEGVFALLCMVIPMMSNLQALPRYFIGTAVTVFALVEWIHKLPELYRRGFMILYCTLNPILLILWFAQHYIVT
ncbi:MULTISPECIES: mannosyltransferase family protein [unclassified Oceanispirochaeta]|uniref:mannosyltransferase family protein n=1 Tax=unclassified Oceanispirochaeta TaxID=2635722 RepID=UPI000E096C0B|nr:MULTISPECIES: mannosyltransferase family protein [unclassified Oceanispirochaeta]MBF9017770.1 glycosyltransferase family 39 protein [Oceanispirochaeta sp. M2]NPD74334.1 hypothetical protein [Oceanispirochaeta sp. M1]RDG29814.1 hypothetical protein DV872_19725 [Oceanispirochaeta sp. M1]